MSSQTTEAKRLARLLRAIADQLENNPNFLNELMPSKSKQVPKGSAFDLFSAIQEGDIEGVRQKLAEMDIKELKSLVYKYKLDTTDKVRKWKQKDRIIEFLIEAASRRADFGASVFPTRTNQKEAKPQQTSEN